MFTEVVRQSCGVTMPATNEAKQNIGSPWWTHDLENMKKEAKTLRRRIAGANPNRRQQVYDEYSRERETYKLAIERAVTSSWKSFCS